MSSNSIQETINSLFQLAYAEAHKLSHEVQNYLFYPNSFNIDSLLSIHDQVSSVNSVLAYWTALFAVYLPLEHQDISLGLPNTAKIKRMKQLRPEYFEIVLEAFEPALMKYVTNAEEKFLYDWFEALQDLVEYPCLSQTFSWLKLRLKENLLGSIHDFLISRKPEQVLDFLERFSQVYSIFNDMIQIFNLASIYILDIIQDLTQSKDNKRVCLIVMQKMAKFKFKLGKKALKLFEKIGKIFGKFDDEKMIDVQVSLSPLFPGIRFDDIILDPSPVYQNKTSQCFVRVFRGTERQNYSLIAKEYFDFKNDCDYSWINEEIRTLTSLNKFTNISKIFIKLFYVYTNPNQIVFIMEDGGQNLMDLLTLRSFSKNFLDSELIESWIYDLIDGFAWLETCKIFHRNIKPHNMLVNNENSIKVIDFSTSQVNDYQESSFMPSQMNQIQGTEGYMAPELREALSRGEKSTYFRFGKADVFSLGLTILQIITLQRLDGYNFLHSYPALMAIINNCQAANWVKELLSKMLQVDRKKRASFRKCMECLPGRSSTIVN